MTRRSFLQVGGMSALGMTLGDLLHLRQAAASESRAKSVILLWLWGGVPHLDTFDLKPQAPLEYRGTFRPVSTNVPGMQISELLPLLGRQMDKWAIIRSMTHTQSDHGLAGTMGLTGTDVGGLSLGGGKLPGVLRPTWGSIVARTRNLPPPLRAFVALGDKLHQGHRSILGEGGAGLGSGHDPFRLIYDLERGIELAELTPPKEVTIPRGDRRAQLLREMDDQLRARPKSKETQALARVYEEAFAMMKGASTAQRLFDLTREPERMRNRYGHTRFGQSCLLARRLVEAGVPFIQVNWSSHVEAEEDAGDGGWDGHYRNFEILQDRMGWLLDQSMSALVEDLDQRGLLDSTLVLAVGEFGRTPKINDKAGRDHWPNCYSACLAGGGVQGGRVLGQSDPRGEQPADNPVAPAALGATMLSALGVSVTDLTLAGVTPLGAPIRELF